MGRLSTVRGLTSGRTLHATAVTLVMTMATGAGAPASASAGSPCLQELARQKAEAEQGQATAPRRPNWLSRNAEKLAAVVGGAGGALAGRALCKDRTNPVERQQCMAMGALGGAFLGSKLGKMLSEADQRRYQEATYKVALTGRPQSLTLDTGCMVVEPASEEVFEERQVEIALAPDVAAPQRLRAVAKPHARQSPAAVALRPAGQQMSRVGANTPLFVMGSTDAGKYLLVGREDPDQGFVAAGYVDAQGWVASPDSDPALIDGAAGQHRVIQVGAEVPCRQVSNSIRVEASNRTETHAAKVCRLPNGMSESV